MNTTASPALQLKNVTKAFGAKRVLDGVRLDLFPGEVVALVGENGSGKSTTARIMAGVIQPDDGDIVVNGKCQYLTRPAQARQLGVCYVGQEPALVPTMSVANNLTLPETRLERCQKPKTEISNYGRV